MYSHCIVIQIFITHQCLGTRRLSLLLVKSNEAIVVIIGLISLQVSLSVCLHVHVDYAEMCLNIFLQVESACRFLLALILFQWVRNQSDVLKPGFPMRISHIPFL